jgi:hypothetical protein
MNAATLASYYTDAKVAELQAAFNRVAPKPNWKTAIDAIVIVVNDAELATIAEAVTFYTGSIIMATVVRQDGMLRSVRVQAAGYYVAIGA